MEIPSINQRIAAALSRVRTVADQNSVDIVQSINIQRTDRELLAMTGWLQEIIQGWYMIVRPDTSTGDSAAWYTNIWDFLKMYHEAE